MTPSKRPSIFYILPLILYLFLIFLISSFPDPPAPDYGLNFSDKINHVGAYAIMMVLSFYAGNGIPYLNTFRKRLWVGFAFTLLYGAIDEIHQTFVPGREGDSADWIADAVGGILGAVVLYWLNRRAIIHREDTLRGE